MYNHRFLLTLSHDNAPFIPILADSLFGGFGIIKPTDNQLYMTGPNTDGSLGVGDTSPRISLTSVSSSGPWRTVGVGFTNTAAIKKDGTLWTWGGDAYGSGGRGTVNVNRSVPVMIGSNTNWTYLSTYLYSVGAIRTDGTLWTWGRNSSRQLGLGDTSNRSSPTRVGTASNWKMLATGIATMVGMQTDGSIWSWGTGASGETGLGTTGAISVPTRIGTLNDWDTIAGSNASYTARKKDGTMWAWGDNADGQLAQNNTIPRSSPVQIGSANNWKFVSTQHAIKNDGTLWGWGYNGNFEVGDGTTINRSSPIQIGTATNWASVYSSRDANRLSCAITTDNRLYIWGTTTIGFGGGTFPTPTQIPL